MTKIIANDNFGHQIVFDSYTKVEEHFKCPILKIKKSIDEGMPLTDSKSAWWLDVLFEGE